ncbi:MAG: Uma2 family endonuclease [Cyanosarcina radialis HA8281-LM2]|jgi:Uma2 family endonuclease|nr:Uma2 family endonuclease [Cyanosarcina radialis HA8281-LM2]
MNQATELLTFEKFLEFEDDTDNLYELVAGQVIPMSEPSGEHESIVTFMTVEFELEIRRLKLNLETHSKTLCQLAPKDGRRPDILVIDRDKWRRNTKVQAALRDEPPELVVEIVSTNWEEDYQKKPLWYAAFGVPEYWIVDPLLHIDRYPSRKNPAIAVPTVSVMLLKDGQYRVTKTFAEDRRIESDLFPELQLTPDRVFATVI